MTFKLALKNISSKPWRAVATIFVVAVAVSLIFAMLSFSDAVYDYLFQVETAGAGISDITIKTNSTSDRIFGADGIENIEGVDTVVPTLNLFGLYRENYLSLRGFDKGDYQTFSQMEIIDGDVSAIDQNTDNVVISESMAKAYNLSVGSSLEIEMGERKVAFYVVAIYMQTYDFDIFVVCMRSDTFVDQQHSVSLCWVWLTTDLYTFCKS